MNWEWMKAGYPPIDIKLADRVSYASHSFFYGWVFSELNGMTLLVRQGFFLYFCFKFCINSRSHGSSRPYGSDRGDWSGKRAECLWRIIQYNASDAESDYRRDNTDSSCYSRAGEECHLCTGK